MSIHTHHVLLVLLLWISNATCLAVSEPQKFTQVLSTKKGTGISKTHIFQSSHKGDGASLKDGVFLQRKASLPSPFTRATAGLRSTFLPSGYPKSTPPGYLSYAAWSWVQDLSTQLRGVLATQRVLEGVGVGREGATALSALLNFLVRDGCGMAANLLFTSVASSSFSTDGKRWRLFADIMVDIGITLEVCATVVPTQFFLPMISVGSMCKAICGVAAGAVGGVFNLHWAKGSDIADIQAKFGAQHTVTGSLGLIFAGLFAKSVSEFHGKRLWSLYLSLTALHVYANTQCMKLIIFDYLNTPRMNILVNQFLNQWKNGQGGDVSLLVPIAMARKEPLFFLSPQRRASPHRVLFGDSFDAYSRISNFNSENELLTNLSWDIFAQKYVISANKRKVVVSLSSDATPRDKAKAYLHAALLGRAAKEDSPELVARMHLDVAWPLFESKCEEVGWDLDKTELHTEGYELSLVGSDDAEVTI